MKNQNQVPKKGSGKAAATQATTSQGRAGDPRSTGITISLQDPKGRERARVHFPSALAARVKVASRKEGISISEFITSAMENFVRKPHATSTRSDGRVS